MRASGSIVATGLAVVLTLVAVVGAVAREPAPANPFPAGGLFKIGATPGVATVYLSLDDMSHAGDAAEGTMVVVLNTPFELKGKGAIIDVSRRRIDCAARTIELLGGKAYDATGFMIFDRPREKPKTAPKDSPLDTMIEILCNDLKPGPTVTGAAEALAAPKA